jgi:PPM family protein phosphatase
MKSASLTHPGLVSKVNQDSLLLKEGGYGLFGVADGMGGHKAGDVASRLAVLMLERVLEDATPSELLLRSAIKEVNQMVFSEQVKDKTLDGMGSTLTVIWEDSEHVLLGHVGDSRAYLFRAGMLTQVSTDHSVVGEMLRAGAITKKMAAVHPYRHMITRAIGSQDDIEVDVISTAKKPGDRWLICSDGLTEYAADDFIAKCLKTLPIQMAAEELMQKALDSGGRDNISLIVLETDQ